MVNPAVTGQETPWPQAGYDNRKWRQSAACLHADQDLFFPVGSTGNAADEIRQAKLVCAGCPVRLACLQFALTTNQEFGVWGGCDEDERHQLRREWRAARHKFSRRQGSTPT